MNTSQDVTHNRHNRHNYTTIQTLKVFTLVLTGKLSVFQHYFKHTDNITDMARQNKRI